jgi:Zn-dependent protease with chaperone function
MTLNDPKRTSTRLRGLEADCADSPQRFSMLTSSMAAALALAYVFVLGLAFFCIWTAVDELTSPLPEHDLWPWAVFLVATYVMVTGLWALRPSFVPINGQRLTRERVPKLFHLLDKVALKTGVRLPQEVVLGTELRVQTLAHAWLGLLGWHRHSLVLGLPLLLTLDVKQLASVVAHEMAHVGPTHGRVACWAYAMRITWARLANQWGTSATEPSRWLLLTQGAAGLFLRYLFPYLNARALVLSRHQAFAADKVARRVAGSQASMDALVRLKVQNEYLVQAFWPEVLGRARHAPAPNVLPYRAMIQRLSSAKAHPMTATWLVQALQQNAAVHDTHPSLSERLARAKLSARLPKTPQHSAAELLLHDALDAMVVEMDVAWQREATVVWAELHRDYLTQHHLERELQVEGERGALHPDDHLLWARAARKTQGDAASEALLRLMLIDHADDINARCELGSLLIDQPDANASTEGAQLLRALGLTQDHPRALPAALRYGQWLSLNPHHEDATFWKDEIGRIEHRALQAGDALLNWAHEHGLTAPDLSPRGMRRVRELLVDGGAVQQAYWVSKRVASFPDWRYAVLVVSLKPGQRLGNLQIRLEALLQSMGLPIALAVVDAADPAWSRDEKKEFLARLVQVSGSALFSVEVDEVQSSATPNRYMPA